MITLRTIVAAVLLLVGLSFVCRAENGLGVGIVSISFDEKTVIRFYKKPGDAKPVETIEFFDDKSVNGLNIKNLEIEKKWLQPETLWLDYSAFNFRCKTKTKEWLEVVTNNETGKTQWIKNTRFTKFFGWETYLKNMFGVGRIAGSRQPIRKSPANASPVIKYSGGDCFQVRQMKGDWIEIFTPDYCDENYT